MYSQNKCGHTFATLLLVPPSHVEGSELTQTCDADGLNGEQSEYAFGDKQSGQWSGASLLSKASMSLKKSKVAILSDDEVDDYDWTCQGCLVGTA